MPSDESLIARVDAAVPDLPRDIREEVIQECVLLALQREGALTLEAIGAVVRRVWREHPSSRFRCSLDDFTFDDHGQRTIDRLSAEDLDRFITRQHRARSRIRCAPCPRCGSRDTAANGHTGLGVAISTCRTCRRAFQDGTRPQRIRGAPVSRLAPDHPHEWLAWRKAKARAAMCSEWRRSFEMFLLHIGPSPRDGARLQRLSSARPYEPGNVRWKLPPFTLTTAR